jgi:DNA-binding MarR family transcriptional regulator
VEVFRVVSVDARQPTPVRLNLLLLVVSAHHRLGQLVERELTADGVETADYAVLSLVGVRAPVRLTEIAEELGMPLTTTSDAIRRLEARGHVGRDANPLDGRSVLFGLTAEGDETWRRGWPALRRVNALLAEELEDPVIIRGALEELRSVAANALARNTVS